MIARKRLRVRVFRSKPQTRDPKADASTLAGFHTHARRRTLQQNFTSETEEFCRAATSSHPNLTCWLHEPRTLNEAAEVLLVQMRTENGFDRSLQLVEREFAGHEFKDHGPVFDLGPHTSDGRS